jgi:hypothetical protein
VLITPQRAAPSLAATRKEKGSGMRAFSPETVGMLISFKILALSRV